MRNHVFMFSVVMFGLTLVRTLGAFTPAETNRVVGIALSRVLMASSDDCRDGEEHEYVPEDDVHTWQGFFHFDMPGWSFDDKKAAFDWYLSTLGTADLRNLPDGREKLKVRMALGQCSALGYTNSVLSLKALALNPQGIYRDRAIELTIRFSPVDDSATTFVETIMTNMTTFSRVERGAACGCYAAKLIASLENTDEVVRQMRERAIGIYYRHRFDDVAGVVMLDRLFLNSITGYEMSSNRLEFVNHALAHPDCTDMARRKFTIVTNQLLSAGQPLQQLNIVVGGASE